MPKPAGRGIGYWPLYPFVFAAHPILALLLNNVSKAPLSAVLLPLTVVEGAVFLIFLLCRVLSGSWRRSALYSFLIIVLALFFQRFEDALVYVAGKGLNDRLTIVLWLVLLAVAWSLIWRSDSNFRAATAGLNAAALVIVAVPIFGIGYHNFHVMKVRATAVAAANQPAPTLTAPASGELPDIWYIVLDRYARGDVLQSQYDFDNSAFLKKLTENGFQVLHQSAANYQRTAHSIASTFNLDYLDKVGAVTAESPPDWVILHHLMEDFKVWRALKPLGYEYSHFGSWWTPTAYNRLADRSINWKSTPTFQRYLWGHSLPGRVAKALGWREMDYRGQQCERVAYKFDQMMDLTAHASKPKFVFAHFLLPHPPFVLSADGTCLSVEQASARSRRDNYIDQVRFTNDRLMRLINHIKAQQGREPIIILQADEGPWPVRIAGDERYVGMDTTPVNWATLSGAELLEKLAIFNAIHLPGEAKGERLPATMTPVNTFRLIFRRWFGADLPPLPDESYVYLDNQRIFSFQRVTEHLR